MVRDVAAALLFSPALLLLGAPGIALAALIWLVAIGCFLHAAFGR